MRYKAKPYQTEAIKFVVSLPCAAIFLGCSLGKTVITASGIHLLKKHNYPEVAKGQVLIVAPALAAAETWPSEFAKWDHLSGYKIGVLKGGAKGPEKRIKLLEHRTDYDFITISADLVYWLVDYYGPEWPFTTVVVDELSMFKDGTSRRTKSLIKARKYIKRVIGLTGTPTPSGCEDLWAEFRVVDGGKRLFYKFKDFQNAFMEPYTTVQVPAGQGRTKIVDLYRMTPQGKSDVIERIKPITLSMRTTDKIKMPELVTVDHVCKLTPKLLEFQKTFAKDRLALFKNSEEGKAVVPYTYEELSKIIDEGRLDDIVTVKSAGILKFKLQQWASGTIYADDKSAIECHKVKLDMLSNLLIRLGGEHCLIAYWFTADRDRIVKRLERDGYTPHEILTPGDIQRWNNGEYQVCLVHPARCGRSLNLQNGGRHLIWFNLTWSLELYQQLVYRLYRQGQTADTVIIHRIITEDTVDEQMIQLLESRDLLQQDIFTATGSTLDLEIRNIVSHFIEKVCA